MRYGMHYGNYIYTAMTSRPKSKSRLCTAQSWHNLIRIYEVIEKLPDWKEVALTQKTVMDHCELALRHTPWTELDKDEITEQVERIADILGGKNEQGR